MTLKRQVKANRENGLKGGVRTSRGKAVSRLNAHRHSIFTSGLTPEDSEEIYVAEDDLIAELRPAGRVEKMLVEKLALTYLRMQRCARAEAEYHIRTWKEPNAVLEEFACEQLQRQRDCGARAVPFKEKEFTRMVELIGLYDARLTSQFLKFLHEIERRQRLRAGENVPPPVVADLTIHADTERTHEGIASATGGVAQPPSAVRNGLPALAQARPPVPHTPQEQAPAEQLQDREGDEDTAQKTI